MPWTPSRYYRPGPTCTDWRDNVPPHNDPPARREVAEKWLARTREHLATGRDHLRKEQQAKDAAPRPRHRFYPAPGRTEEEEAS